VVTGLSAAGIVLLFFDPLQYFMTVDQYGTFEYRRRVFDVSVQAISYRPFLGSPTFHPIMEQLRNHDGIIDIVNAYVQIPVRYGVIGLVFFAGAGIAAAHSMLRSRAAAAQTGDQSAELTYRALAAVSIGLLVTIGCSSASQRHASRGYRPTRNRLHSARTASNRPTRQSRLADRQAESRVR
jgi:O-antigen ligase